MASDPPASAPLVIPRDRRCGMNLFDFTIMGVLVQSFTAGCPSCRQPPQSPFTTRRRNGDLILSPGHRGYLPNGDTRGRTAGHRLMSYPGHYHILHLIDVSNILLVHMMMIYIFPTIYVSEFF